MITDAAIKQRLMRDKGWWGELTVHACFAINAANHPQREAVVDPLNRSEFLEGLPRRLSYAELAEEVDRATVALHAAGLRQHDVLCVQLPNCVEQFSVYLACARLGIIVMPVPIQYREHELGFILVHSEAVAVLTGARDDGMMAGFDHAAMFLRLKRQAPNLRLVLSLQRLPGADVQSLTAAMERVTDPAAAAAAAASGTVIGADDIYTICWTSGTEARPKGVPRTHNEWFAQGRMALGLSRLTGEQRLLNPFPMINMAGLATCFFTWLLSGCTAVQHHPFKLPLFLQQLRDERIDHTVAPPAILTAWLNNEALTMGIDFKRLTRIGSGGAPLSSWMVSEFQRRWGVAILNNFGSNEGGVLVSSELDVPDPVERATCFPRLGIPGLHWRGDGMQTVQTRLVDLETERDIEEPGIPGELRFAGPTVFGGYLKAPELNEKAFDSQGYYRSGDIFEIAGERNEFYRYVGRHKDIIIRGGMNISAEEIDALLLAHPKVADAATVGYPDDSMGERVCAFVVPRPGLTLDLKELTDYMRQEQRVAVFKLPERLEVVPALPRNPVGKLLRRELRERLRKSGAAGEAIAEAGR